MVKKVCLYLIILFLIIYYTAFAASPGDTFLQETLVSFAADIYEKYSSSNFRYVYNRLHPVIMDIITEREYVDFQKENFSRYNLKIENINIQQSLIKESVLPDYCTDIITDDDIRVYEVPIEYEMTFSIGGSRKKQEVKKEVILAIEEEEIYLLWNPSVIDD